MFTSAFNFSIIKRAIENKRITIEYINIRNFGIGKHRIVDDTPYGGGPGMIMRVDVLAKALESARCSKKCKELTILLDPQGEQFTQKKVKKISTYDHLILLCGRYEGVDERIRNLVDVEISIGDYILTGGEIPAMVVVDAVSRLIPGVLGQDESSLAESFQEIDDTQSDGTIQILEYPQYTRPDEFEEQRVPKILLSGNHADIKEWRRKEAIKKTKRLRLDLLKKSS